jgi:glycosidase
MYLYQGEELGLPEVTDIADDQKQDPAFFRDRGSNPGRDGCRVPLPWTSHGGPVVSFRRQNGWTSVTNFGTTPISLPPGTVLMSSERLEEPTLLPADTTAWIRPDA